MRWFLLLLVCYQALSHPTSNELTRLRRELIECCPCNGEDTLVRSSQLAASRVDDCPCRARSADSEGASSIFFPSAIRPDGTNMRSNNPKEEQKNLLEPEVGLATSMLETLREATEEEYQDALARDAARSAADARSDESKNLIIVVEPRSEDEEMISKASNVQESRCVNSLGSSLNRMRTVPKELNLLSDIHNLPVLRRPSVPNLRDIDTDVGASDVKEMVTDAKGQIPLLKAPLLRSNILKMTSENVDEDSDASNSKISPLLGTSKVKPLLEGFKLPLIQKLKDPAFRNIGDNNPASSSNLEILDDPENKPGLPRFAKRPSLLKNLLKLKDVELIPKKSLLELPKMTIPKLRSQVDENCDHHENEEKTVLNKSENEPVKTVGEFEDKLHDEDCIDETNRSINEDQDGMGSPSNIKTTVLESPGNDSSKQGYQNFNNEQSINDYDLNLTPLGKQSDSIEIENFRADNDSDDQDLSNFDKTIIDDGKMKSTDDLDNDSTKEGTTSRELLSEDQDAFTDSSNINNIITEPINTIVSPISNDSTQDENHFSPIENSSQVSTNSEIFPQNPEDENGPINKNQGFKPIPSLSDTLSAIRNNIKNLDRFIKTNRIQSLNGVEANSADNTNQKVSANDTGLSSNDDDTIIIFDNDGNPEVIENKNAKDAENVTLDDLQKLSDNLLDSSNHDQKLIIKPELKNQRSEMKSDINNSDEKSDFNNPNENISSSLVNDERDEHAPVDKTCQSKLNNNDEGKSSPLAKSVGQNLELQDMTVDASEPIMSELPKVFDPLNLGNKIKSSIFSNPIAQPSINIDPLNLLNNPLDDLINLNPTMPTLPSLDDIRDQISNVFSTNERSADDAEDCDYDEKEIEKMALEASSNNAQTKFPTLKPLDNLNVDLFKLGPMKSPQPDPLSSNRKLNLNSFRAKVPVPKNFELKPVKLESSLQNKDGLQTASLRLTSSGPISKTKLPSKVNLLGRPAVNFPSLDEIKESLHRNPSTLLGNPIRHDISLFNPRPFGVLNQDTEKTIKGIKKRLRTSFKSPKIAQPAITDPQEFLDDVGDKLKAIHYDLNDRLASVHDNILESTKLTLPSPLSGANDKKKSKSATPSFRMAKVKPMRLQTLGSTNSPQKVYPPIEKSGRKASLGSPHSKTTSQKVLSKPSTQDVAASDPVPVRTKLNSQIRASPKDTRPFPIQRLGDRDSLFKTKPSVPKSSFRKPNLKENKVTITFDPTTAKPILRSGNLLSESRTPKTNVFETGNDFNSRGFSRSKANTGIGRTSLFTENPWKAQQPVELPSRLQNDSQDDTNKIRNNLNTKISSIDKNKLLGTENKSLSRVNDAVKRRLANLNSLKNSDIGKVNPTQISKASNDRAFVTSTDMLKSASENVNAVTIQEPLKENVSYKCKLLCTKE